MLDIVLKTDMSKCTRTDAISDTVDYERVGNACRLLAEKKEFKLLETFAFEALETIFEQFPAVLWAKIRVKKRVPFARYSAVELEKTRE